MQCSLREEPMSALGQKRTCAVQWPMSALPPKATVKADVPVGRFSIAGWLCVGNFPSRFNRLPKAPSSTHFDHFLIDTHQQIHRGVVGYCWLRQMKTYLPRITIQPWLTAVAVMIVAAYGCVTAQAESSGDFIRIGGSHLRSDKYRKNSFDPPNWEEKRRKPHRRSDGLRM